MVYQWTHKQCLLTLCVGVCVGDHNTQQNIPENAANQFCHMFMYRGTVTYLDIHDDPTMTIGIFQLPPGSRMPLHDHPGMTVFSRCGLSSACCAASLWLQQAIVCSCSG